MNIIDKIKVGDTLYSPIMGEITVTKIDPKEICNNNIKVRNELGLPFSFNKEGKCYTTGECVLFPSKKNRDWSTHRPKFNINTLEPFDKVLVRDDDDHCWTTGFYSHYEDNGDMRFFISSSVAWIQCIPYNNDTKHLVGTTKMPDDRYINW